MAASLRAVFPTGTGASTAIAAAVSTTSVAIVAGDVLEVHVTWDTSGSDAGVTLSCKLDPAGSNLSPDGQSAIVHSNGQTAGFEQVFYFKNPPVGTFTVTTTASASSTDIQQKCRLFAGTDNGTPTITTFAPSGTGTSTAVTITSPSVSGGIVSFSHTGGTAFSSTSATNNSLANNGGAGAAQSLAGSTAAGTGSNVIGTGTMSGADWSASIALSWAPAGGAAINAFAHWQQRPPGFLAPGADMFQPGPIGSAELPSSNPTAGAAIALTASISASGVVGTSSGAAINLTATISASQYQYVAGVDGTGRYFTDASGQPIFPVIDHQWHLIAWGGDRSELSPGTTTPLGVFQAYSAHQASKGINAALVMAICSDQGGPVGPFTDGRTWDGIAPFTGGAIGVLNNTYWSRVDDMLNSMAAQGITCVLNIIASYTIAAGTAMAGITTTNAATYGAALAARYKNFPNIVWHLGADYFATKEAEFAAIVTALRAGGDTHLVTCEYMAESDSSVDSSNAATGTFGRSSAMSYRDIYTYNAAYLETERAYALSANPSVLPSLYFNGYYDQQTSAWDTVLLDDKLWAWTSGSPGFYYGSEATWQWGVGVYAHILGDQFPNTWFPAFKTFLAGLTGWQKIVPDISSAFITSARGTKVTALTPGGGATPYSGGNTYLTGGVTADGKLAVLYTPTNRTITIDGTKMVAAYTAKWVDPYTFAVTAATPSATSYATPGTNSQGNNRWLLVLQEAAGTGATIPLTDAVSSAGVVGTVAGATVSLTASITAAGVVGKATGATVSETFTVTAAGVVALAAGASLPLTDTVAAAGAVGTSSGAAVPLTDTVAAAGAVGTSAGASVALAVSISAAGVVGVSNGAAVPLTDTIAAAGAVGASAGSTVPLTDTIASAGAVGTSSGASIALTASISAAGSVSGGSTSQGASIALTVAVTPAGVVGKATGASVGLVVGITAAGVVGEATGAALALTDAVSSAGVVGKATGAAVPLTDTVNAAGTVGAAVGASLALTASITATGVVGGGASSGGATIPLTASIHAAGQVGKSGAATLQLHATVTAAGIVGGAERDISITVELVEDRWTATILDDDRWTAALTDDRWSTTILEDS